jgi:hypothetical protein
VASHEQGYRADSQTSLHMSTLHMIARAVRKQCSSAGGQRGATRRNEASLHMTPSRRLGNALPEIFPIALGCMGMSGIYGQADESESVATIHAALYRRRQSATAAVTAFNKTRPP